jgi:hypothetical protein
MQIDGAWLLCDDGILRPTIRGEILTGDGSWVEIPFLVDTGADRTAFSAAIFAILHLQPIPTQERVSGVGGLAESVVIATQIRLTRENGEKAVFRGQFAAVTELEALDMSVLGRDITNLFAVIVDRPGDFVCLLGQRHHYTIEQR